ncbi:hypothetical protein [Methanonatronarchaeum sp. AMET-Sl]|uniref:hypothetical protein n=1 Tax=Methanonatronarchaeum sp. AMET-Sl TaxID=3037654 RepID=UPI00244DCB41|nr:hypothetical protein [Methanonatronarchaeum sp. AMET-Sl]WGI17642.1 hypothetical protein QEN48_01130 [Methanonatronarchaeum sp. AMET-Sl]
MDKIRMGKRLLFVLVLLVGLFFLNVGYAEYQVENEILAEELAEGYGEYVGGEFSGSGEVVSVSPLVISIEYGLDSEFRLELVGVDRDVEEGEILSVYGVLEPDETLEVKDMVVQSQTDYLYMYLVSIFGLLITLGLFFRYWKPDFNKLVFRRRE